jgi:hypothetical protein
MAKAWVSPSLVPAVAGLGLAVYAWWAVGLSGFSMALTVAIVTPGVLAVALGALARPRWLGHPRRDPAQRCPGMAVWVALVATMAAWQLAAYLQHPRHDYPTLSSLANTALDPRPVRAAAFLAWLAIAAWLARR